MTAAFASFFLDQDKQQEVGEFAQLEERLARVEQKQDELLKIMQERIFGAAQRTRATAEVQDFF